MNRTTRVGFGAIVPASFAALQWRLMLLWLAGVLLPTAIVALPISQFLGSQLDMSVHSAEYARQFSPVVFGDLISAARRSSELFTAGNLIGVTLALLLSPLLTGFTLTAIRAGRVLNFGELLHGGLSEYGRLFRLLLLSVIPFGVALGLGALATHLAGKNADTAILESEIRTSGRIAMVVALLLFVIAHATVEAGRAQFAADANLRSAFRAWWRGLKLVFRRPLVMLGIYLVIALFGLGIAAGFVIWRLNVEHVSFSGFLLALLLTQCIALALGWIHSARLFAYAKIVRPVHATA